jgi:uncharacterized protein
MKAVFADSYYFFALVNKNEAQHSRAREFAATFGGQFVTTGFVLIELADGLTRPSERNIFGGVYDSLVRNPAVQIIGCSDDWLSDGLSLYRSRLDKAWSLTDCISFVVMQRQGITEALTGDHHLEQAGFVALLK